MLYRNRSNDFHSISFISFFMEVRDALIGSFHFLIVFNIFIITQATDLHVVNWEKKVNYPLYE
jgi:hypothetical protein